MRRPLVFLALILVLPVLFGCGPGEPDAPRRRVHLLALDGADLDIVRGLIAAGRLPNFARVLAEGASGGLFSGAPRHAPVVWTTVATGRPAREHGVEELVVADRAANRLRPVTSGMRRTEALWDIASRGDREVRVTGWPGTWPPEPVRGILVPDRFAFSTPVADRVVFPPAESERLDRLVRHPGDLSPAARARFLPPGGEDERESLLVAALAVEETRRAAAAAIGTGADLVMRWSAFPGVASHLFMASASPKLPRVSEEDFERYGQVVVAAYDDSDRLLGETLAGLEENAVLLVVSPYGFRHGIQRLATDPAPDSVDAAIQHRPRGFLLAWGAGVRPGAEIAGARAVDIAPTVLGLLGLPAAEDLAGRFIEEEFVDPPPDGTVPTWELGRYERQMSEVAGDGEQRRALLDLFPELAWIGSATHLRGPLSGAVVAIRQKRGRDLRRHLLRAEEELPESARLRTFLGDLLRATRKPERAEAAYRDALRLDPSAVAAHAGLSLVLAGSGRTREALAAIETAIRLEPGDAGLHAIRGGLLIGEGDGRAGMVAYARAVELEPDDVPVRARFGSLLLARGRLAGAERELRKAVRLDPYFREAWRDLGITLLRRVEGTRKGTPAFDEAVAAARQALDEGVRRCPEYARAWLNRAALHEATGDAASARRDAQKAAELDPEDEAIRSLLERLD